MMSNYYRNPLETTVTIPSVDLHEGTAFYSVRVTCHHNIEWTVLRRYRDFHELHEKLLAYSIARDLLPKKRVIGNTSATFLEQRREDLQRYLQTLAHMLQKRMPLEFVEFLDFHRYDVIFVLQRLALDIFRNGERYLTSNNRFWTFTILEVHAIATRLRLPCAEPELRDAQLDFSHVLDFCAQLTGVRIVPTRAACEQKEEFLRELVTPLGTSNVLASTLALDLAPFAGVRDLELIGIVPMNIEAGARVRECCERIVVNFTRAQTIQNVLAPEAIHSGGVMCESSPWTGVKSANLSHNDIWQLDGALRLIPNVESLLLDGNRLRKVANIRHLHKLSYLSLNGNLIEDLSGWFAELGNVHTLNLASNRIVSLKGMRRLRSIRSLDLSCNLIESIDEIDEIAALPVLEVLGLNGNPLALEVDYRPRVMARFGERCAEIVLDNERGLPGEIDKAMVLAALRKSRVG